jgi:hypothetical protein
MDAKELVERLENFPQLKERFEKLLKIAENQDGLIELADDAEDLILATSRGLNQETLQLWAETQSANKSREFQNRHKSTNKDTKKKFNGTLASER